MIGIRRILLTLFVVLTSTTALSAKDPAPLPETTPWDVKSLSNAPEFQWVNTSGPVHSLTYRGEPYQGKATRVFAYFASPRTRGTRTDETSVPGIVLVHGGGGTAFSKWAEIWAKRGYAAIAMDLAGRGEGRKRMANGGPDQGDQTKFRAIDGPVRDQWSYHAVANVILAHSLLLSFDEVDKDRTALTGISWGGYLTCIAAGLDQRFKMAMPVYGCGFLHENSAWVKSQFDKMTARQVARWVSLWDPSRYIGSATMPIVFLNGTNDFAYPMDSYAKTCRLVQGEKNYSIQLGMRHGHIFDFPEFFLAVDQYLKGGAPLAVISTPQVVEGVLTANVRSSVELVSARLHFTTGPHKDNKTRSWTTTPLEVHGATITGKRPPDNATVWYVDVTDQRNAVVSSEVMVSGRAR